MEHTDVFGTALGQSGAQNSTAVFLHTGLDHYHHHTRGDEKVKIYFLQGEKPPKLAVSDNGKTNKKYQLSST